MDNKALKRQIDHIRHLMAEGKVEEAIDELRALSQTIRDSATKDEIIAISSRFNRLERDLRNQVIGLNDLNLQQNQLTNQVLSLLSSLEISYQRVTGSVPEQPTPAKPVKAAENERPAWLIPGAIALLALLLIGGWLIVGRDNTTTVVSDCDEPIERARTAYFEGDYTTAKTLLQNLPDGCKKQDAVSKLNSKVETALARVTATPTDTEPTKPDAPTENEDEKEWCNGRYREAVVYLRQKEYDKADAALREVIARCGNNDRLQQLSGLIENARNTPPAQPKPLKNFMLRFPEAYLIHSGSTTQLVAGNPISYGQDWEVKKLKSFLYHVRHAKWSGFYWQVNTSRGEVNLVRGGNFGSMGGTHNKEDIRVVSYPNKDNPSRFQLYFSDCYLIYAPPSTLQVIAEGKVLQREEAWDIKKVDPTTFHLKNKAWRTNLFWKVDLEGKAVSRFRGTSDFGKAGASSAEQVGAKVEVKYD